MSRPIDGFDDKVDIGATLVEPKDHGEEMTATIDQIGGNLGTIDDIWQWFFGWSLWEWIFVPLSGDWGQLRSYSEGWDALGEAAEGVSTNLSRFTAELGESWEGEAADAFAGYMKQWTDSLANEKDMCADMSSVIGDLADNAETAFDAILSAINLIVDIVLIAVKIVSFAKALKKAGEALTKAKAAKKVISELASMIETVIAYIKALVKCIEEGNDNQPMPSGEVAGPDAPGTSKKKSGSTKGEPQPVP